MPLKCLYCLSSVYKAGSEDVVIAHWSKIQNAVTVFWGKALCLKHALRCMDEADKAK